jgi:hypothetical protein
LEPIFFFFRPDNLKQVNNKVRRNDQQQAIADNKGGGKDKAHQPYQYHTQNALWYLYQSKEYRGGDSQQPGINY